MSGAVPGPIGPLLGLLLGLVYAWIASDSLGRTPDPALRDRGLALVGFFGMLVHGPVAGYFVAFAPDWTWAYWVDSQRIPDALRYALVLGDAACPALAFALVTGGERPVSRGGLLRIAAVPGLLAAGWLALSGPRLTVSATYAQFHGDFGTYPVAGSPLGRALLLMWLLWGAGAWWTARSVRRLGTHGSR